MKRKRAKRRIRDWSFVAPDRWKHVAITQKGEITRVYLDGMLVETEIAIRANVPKLPAAP